MAIPVRSIKPFLLILCILLAVFFARIATTSPVSAGVITVNSTDDVIADDGQCTLREAIIAANTDTVSGSLPNECAAGSGPDIIILPAGTYTLTAQLPNVNSEITINGADAATTIIQASACDPILLPGGCEPAAHRLLNVNINRVLQLDRVTLRHGVADSGGAIFNYGSLTLTNSAVTTNKSTSSGGGIYNSSNNGTLILDTSSVSSNLAQTYGGGIMNYGNITLDGSTISGNQAISNEGGGIYNVKAGDVDIPTITDCLISGNSAGSQGGGIRNFGNLNITDSIISDNTAGSYGGGVANTGTMNIDNTTVSGNSSTTIHGGGIINYNTLTITNRSVIKENTANASGGGIFNGNNAVLNISNTTLTANTASNNSGGGIYNGATLNMAYSLIANNTAQTYHGGGIYNAYTGLMDITKIILSGNAAEQSGGGIYNGSSETAIVKDCTLAQNQAKLNGGGIFNHGSMDLTSSTLIENHASSHGGGVFNYASLSIINSTFSANHAEYFGGGLANLSDLSLTNCTFYGNSADSIGGGIFNFSGSTLNYVNTIIAASGNLDCVNSVGGIIGTNSHNLVMENADPPNNCGVPDLSANPVLSPLGNYGGPTKTYALLPASPAIDTGNLSLCPKFDQRGIKRPQGLGCDIGAFELEQNAFIFLPLVLR